MTKPCTHSAAARKNVAKMVAAVHADILQHLCSSSEIQYGYRHCTHYHVTPEMSQDVHSMGPWLLTWWFHWSICSATSRGQCNFTMNSEGGRSWDSVVCIANGYRREDRGSWSSSPCRVKNFLFSMYSRPALGPNQPCIQWVLGALSLGVKRPGCEADRWPPTSAKVMKIWFYTSTPPYVFMV
jgi:hypothetical protein